MLMQVVIRNLWPAALPQFRRHLHRLDRKTLTERFGRIVSDEWLDGYCEATDLVRGAIVGCWIDGLLRGVGELRRHERLGSAAAEVARTLEPAFPDRGFGSVLVQRLVLPARNRGLDRLYILTDTSNGRMRRILRRLGCPVRFAGTQIEADRALAPPNGASLTQEWLEEGWACWCALTAASDSALPMSAVLHC